MSVPKRSGDANWLVVKDIICFILDKSLASSMALTSNCSSCGDVIKPMDVVSPVLYPSLFQQLYRHVWRLLNKMSSNKSHICENFNHAWLKVQEKYAIETVIVKTLWGRSHNTIEEFMLMCGLTHILVSVVQTFNHKHQLYMVMHKTNQRYVAFHKRLQLF